MFSADESYPLPQPVISSIFSACANVAWQTEVERLSKELRFLRMK